MVIPRRLITEFDLKLIEGKSHEYLNSMLIHVNAAPSHRQDKNGLVERHWQTMVSMAWDWLSFLLPFGSLLFVVLQRYVIIFLTFWRTVLLLLRLSSSITTKPD